jgi:hypothetical protein
METDGGGATFRVTVPAVRTSPAVPIPNGSVVTPAPDEERASGQV